MSLHVALGVHERDGVAVFDGEQERVARDARHSVDALALREVVVDELGAARCALRKVSERSPVPPLGPVLDKGIKGV